MSATENMRAALDLRARELAACPHCDGERTLGDCQVTRRLRSLDARHEEPLDGDWFSGYVHERGT